MPRRASGNRGNGKAVIVVFCEGESEQAYTEYLKKRFADVAVIKYPKETGLFERAESRFAKDPQYRDYAEVTDEVWFFFDVEKFPIDDSFFETLGNQDSWDNKWNCHLKIYRSRCR